jgi:iron complex transport system ATP-binding protein
MMLVAENLSYGYPGRTIGSAVAFTLAPGEVVCVLGANGSGKTTLFRTVLGLLPVHGGRVLLNDRSIADWSRTELARALAYVPQVHAGTFPFSVREVVLMGRTANMSLFTAPSVADREAASAAIAALGIGHLADQIYTRISGGERQLTLIARALAQGAQTLVLDEPTVSLDFANRPACWAKSPPCRSATSACCFPPTTRTKPSSAQTGSSRCAKASYWPAAHRVTSSLPRNWKHSTACRCE